jgi:hypothetical protein
MRTFSRQGAAKSSICCRPDAFSSVLNITAGQVRDHYRIPVILGRRGPHYLSAPPRSRSTPKTASPASCTQPGARAAHVGGRLIGRHDRVATLDCAAGKRTTINSAPAGSGKTSLLHGVTDRSGQDRITITRIR